MTNMCLPLSIMTYFSRPISITTSPDIHETVQTNILTRVNICALVLPSIASIIKCTYHTQQGYDFAFLRPF